MKKTVRGMVTAFALYTVLLIATISVIPRFEAVWVQWLLAVLPVLPVIYLMRVLIDGVQQMDELQRQIQLYAAAFSLMLTGVVTFTIGFLEGVGLPSIGMIWVLPMMFAFWGVGGWLASRQYA